MSECLYDISIERTDGCPTTLADYQGKVLLLVNLSRQCFLTSQCQGLQQLHEVRSAEGLVVLGFPTKDFDHLATGRSRDVSTSAYDDLTFPVFSEITAVDAHKHALYRNLIEARPWATGEGPMRTLLLHADIELYPPPELLWNFEKFLVARDGTVSMRFTPDVEADDWRLLDAIERELRRR